MGEHVPNEVVTSAGWDRILDVLSHRKRRLVLFMLARGEPVTESGLQVRGSSDGRRSESGVRHVHLPKLAEAGYVDWNRDTGAITRGPRFDEVAPLLELIENHSDELPPDWP